MKHDSRYRIFFKFYEKNLYFFLSLKYWKFILSDVDHVYLSFLVKLTFDARWQLCEVFVTWKEKINERKLISGKRVGYRPFQFDSVSFGSYLTPNWMGFSGDSTYLSRDFFVIFPVATPYSNLLSQEKTTSKNNMILHS